MLETRGPKWMNPHCPDGQITNFSHLCFLVSSLYYLQSMANTSIRANLFFFFNLESIRYSLSVLNYILPPKVIWWSPASFPLEGCTTFAVQSSGQFYLLFIFPSCSFSLSLSLFSSPPPHFLWIPSSLKSPKYCRHRVFSEYFHRVILIESRKKADPT